MDFTIKEIKKNRIFSLYSNEKDILLKFELIPEPDGIQVSLNMEGFEQSLENLKAFLEGKDLPYV
ncbi:hypothetical protein AB4Y30_08295 [Ornithinibacillus sp. 4-3]|uniref:Uncharacterized protein n=1 Tax=Ornithinibacillus sp. 4-3 TaxID=3231488 RepID=A0AB39HT64_9BACI